MEHDQEILSGTRSACSAAIILVWTVEAILLFSLIGFAAATLLGKIDPQFLFTSELLVVASCCALAAIVSIVFTCMAVATLASAISNIDTRNMQFERLMNARQYRQKEYIPPPRTRRAKDIDMMRIKPERVT